jgi:hypothetical protein
MYEWLQTAGPKIQATLAPIIPALEKMDRTTFVLTVRNISNTIKRSELNRVILSKKSNVVLYPERK